MAVEYRLANGATAAEVRTVQPGGVFASVAARSAAPTREPLAWRPPGSALDDRCIRRTIVSGVARLASVSRTSCARVRRRTQLALAGSEDVL